MTVKQLACRLLSTSSDWHRAMDDKGCVVYYADARLGANQAYVLHGSRGVILGRLFERQSAESGEPQSVALTANDAERILATRGFHLIDRYWGRYVAFWQDAASGTTHVLRDPSGTLPCYETTLRGVRIYFSWMDDCVKLGFCEFSINWRYVSALLPLALLQARATGLNEVSQIHAGERVAIRGDTSESEFCWDPRRVAASEPIEDAAGAAAVLRRMTRGCIHSWASCYTGILHRLSGGIDSSIVLSCLRDAPTRPLLTALIHYSPVFDSDERSFARLAARSARCDLLECERSPDARFETILKMAASPVPRSCLPYTQNDGVEARWAQVRGATAIFAGGGGDQLFYQGRIALAATDYVQRHGIRPGLFAVALDAARAERTSLWHVLRDAIRDGRRSDSWNPLAEAGRYRHLIASDVVESVRNDETLIHAWLRSIDNIPQGKTYHIYSLSIPADYYDLRGSPADAECVQPLLSQPLTELCLRIPTYVLASGGWDRALARRAFYDDVPREIITRRTKGALDQHIKEILRRNLDFVRELLLDGLLVRQGLLDKHKLQEVLSGRPTTIASPTVELYEYISTEAWVQNWSSTRQAAAA